MSEHDSTCALPELPKVTGVQFRHIDGFPGYCVGDDGSVLSCWLAKVRLPGRRGGFTCTFDTKWRPLSPAPDKDGYKRVCIRCNRRAFNRIVHRLILEAFVGPCPEGMQACHDNGVRDDCRLVNLRWDTPKNNHADKWRHGTQQVGERQARAKLTDEQVRDIRLQAGRGVTYTDLGKVFGVTRSTIAKIAQRKTWRHIEV